MTTFGLIITLLGAGSIAANILRLIDCIDRPAPRAPPHGIKAWSCWTS